MIHIKSSREIDLMRKSCTLARECMDFIAPYMLPGTSTEDINKLCHDWIMDRNAYPSPLNYHGFPKSICTSLNEVICHGIPSEKDILKDGDICNIDITTYLNKFHGDTNKTFLIGDVASSVKKFVDITYECMRAGIDQIRPGNHIGDIGASIEKIAHHHGYSVVEEYCGHGIGREFHEEPQVVHVGSFGEGPEIKEGMTFTVEPMINLGKRYCKVLKDNWTVITRDKKWSAQFEHTVLVTKDGYEILTLREEESKEFIAKTKFND